MRTVALAWVTCVALLGSSEPLLEQSTADARETHTVMMAKLDTFKRICTMMASHGKVVTISLKTHFSNVSTSRASAFATRNVR